MITILVSYRMLLLDVQGIEFVLAGNASYPEANTTICVMGVFDTYEKNGYIYCTLREANLL